MRLTRILQQGIYLALISISFNSHAKNETPPPATNLVIEANDIYVPEERLRSERHAALLKFEHEFTYDWNEYASILNNEPKALALDTFVQKLDAEKDLNKEDLPLFGNLLAKLGTYHAHVQHASDKAIHQFELAEPLLSGKSEKAMKAWNDNHLAFAYEKKYTQTRSTADKEKVLYYTSRVTAAYPNQNTQEVAYAHYLRGLVKHDAHEFTEADSYFQSAIEMYEKLPKGRDGQYIRVKNKFAQALLDQGGHDQEAISILEGNKKYWLSKGEIYKNPFAASNSISLAEGYLKTGKMLEAREEIQKAIGTFQHVYGAKNDRLIKAYQLLAETYKRTGDAKLAETYEKKAGVISKS